MEIKEQKRISTLVQLKDDSQLALFNHVNDLEDKLDKELPQIKNVMDRIKGKQGDQGPKGEKGEKGERGERGLEGKQGIQGLKGKNGIDGTDGEDGIDGIDGVNGKDGEDYILTEKDKKEIAKLFPSSTHTIVESMVGGFETPVTGGTGISVRKDNFGKWVVTNTAIDIPIILTTTGTSGAATYNTSTGALNIPSYSSATPYVVVTGATQTITVNTKYQANSASLVTFTLPATAVLGDLIQIRGYGTGLWKVAQNANQVIHGGADTTVGTAGSLAAQTRYDCVTLECCVAGASTEWQVINQRGTLTNL